MQNRRVFGIAFGVGLAAAVAACAGPGAPGTPPALGPTALSPTKAQDFLAQFRASALQKYAQVHSAAPRSVQDFFGSNASAPGFSTATNTTNNQDSNPATGFLGGNGSAMSGLFQPNSNVGAQLFNASVDNFINTAHGNGRGCFTCHVAASFNELTPADVTARFASNPNDPLFKAILADASTDPAAPDTAAGNLAVMQRLALIRINLPNPDFDPSLGNAPDNPQNFHVFRAVPTVNNSRFLRQVTLQDPSTGQGQTLSLMWDMREPTLAHQAMDAERGHAQTLGDIPDDANLDIQLHEQQDFNFPPVLKTLNLQPPKVNPAFAGTPLFSAPLFNPATALHDFLPDLDPATLAQKIETHPGDPTSLGDPAHGAQIFFGTQDRPGCVVCHNMPGTLAGGTSLFQDALTSETSALPPLPPNAPFTSVEDVPALPQFTVRLKSIDASGHVTWQDVTSDDVGIADQTGLLKHANFFKVPQLRGLGTRGRFFSDNRSTNLDEVVAHYAALFNAPPINIFPDNNSMLDPTNPISIKNHQLTFNLGQDGKDLVAFLMKI